LALAELASNQYEEEAAERVAHRLIETYNIDPVVIPDVSFYNCMNFANNALLKKLRDEYRAAHPDYEYYSKGARVYRYRGKRRKPKPGDIHAGQRRSGLASRLCHKPVYG
jgi:hypothetical protein